MFLQTKHMFLQFFGQTFLGYKFLNNPLVKHYILLNLYRVLENAYTFKTSPLQFKFIFIQFTFKHFFPPPSINLAYFNFIHITDYHFLQKVFRKVLLNCFSLNPNISYLNLQEKSKPTQVETLIITHVWQHSKWWPWFLVVRKAKCSFWCSEFSFVHNKANLNTLASFVK